MFDYQDQESDATKEECIVQEVDEVLINLCDLETPEWFSVLLFRKRQTSSTLSSFLFFTLSHFMVCYPYSLI